MTSWHYHEEAQTPYAIEIDIVKAHRYTVFLLNYIKTHKMGLEDVRQRLPQLFYIMAIEFACDEYGTEVEQSVILDILEQSYSLLSSPRNDANALIEELTPILQERLPQQNPETVSQISEALINRYSLQAAYLVEAIYDEKYRNDIETDLKKHGGEGLAFYVPIAMAMLPALMAAIPGNYCTAVEQELRDSGAKYEEWQTYVNDALNLTGLDRIDMTELARKVMIDSGVMFAKEFVVLPQEWYPLGIESTKSSISTVLVTRGQRGRAYFGGFSLEFGIASSTFADGGFYKTIQIPAIKMDNQVYASLVSMGFFSSISQGLSWANTEGGHDERHNVMTTRATKDGGQKPIHEMGTELGRYEDMGLTINPSGNVSNERFSAVSRFLSKQYHYLQHPEDKVADIQYAVQYVDEVRAFVEQAQVSENPVIKQYAQNMGFYLLCGFMRGVSGMWDLDDPDLEPFREAVDSLNIQQKIPAADIRNLLKRYLLGDTEETMSFYKKYPHAPDEMRIAMAEAILPVFESLQILPKGITSESEVLPKEGVSRSLSMNIKKTKAKTLSGFDAVRLATMTQNKGFYEAVAKYPYIYAVRTTEQQGGRTVTITSSGNYYMPEEMTQLFAQLYQQSEPAIIQGWEDMIAAGQALQQTYAARVSG